MIQYLQAVARMTLGLLIVCVFTCFGSVLYVSALVFDYSVFNIGWLDLVGFCAGFLMLFVGAVVAVKVDAAIRKKATGPYSNFVRRHSEFFQRCVSAWRAFVTVLDERVRRECVRFRFITRHGVLVIATVNLVVAVASLAILSFANPDLYSDTSETVFGFVTFPVLSIAGLGCMRGNITYWMGSVWAIPVFYGLLVLNEYIWGLVGIRLLRWLHRLFWIMPEHTIPYDEADLKRSVRRAVILHIVLLLALACYLYLSIPWFVAHMFQGLGHLPISFPFLLQLNCTEFFWINFWYSIPVWVLLLWLDARAYRHLYVTKGRRAAQWWSKVVVMAIVAVFLFSVFAFCQTWLFRIYGRG